MALVNEHYLKLSDNYLFADIAKKVNAFKVSHPKVRVISLGIGDVTQPLCPAVIEAMHKAVDEGLILLKCGTYSNVLRFIAPCIVTKEQIDFCISVLDKLLP